MGDWNKWGDRLTKWNDPDLILGNNYIYKLLSLNRHRWSVSWHWLTTEIWLFCLFCLILQQKKYTFWWKKHTQSSQLKNGSNLFTWRTLRWLLHMMKIKIWMSIICFLLWLYPYFWDTLWKHSRQSLFPGHQLAVANKKGMELQSKRAGQAQSRKPVFPDCERTKQVTNFWWHQRFLVNL